MVNRPSFALFTAAAVLSMSACSDGLLFSQEGDGTGGAGGATTSSNTTSTSSSSATSSASSSGSTGGAGGTGGAGAGTSTSTSASSVSSSTASVVSSSSSGGGGGGPCAHPVCEEGGPLDANCDPCVAQVCAADDFCCNNNWDDICASAVWSICNIDCAPGQPSCASQYDSAPGYYTCTQGTSCSFGFNATQDSCAQFCEGAGGECLEAANNQGMCGLGQAVGCNSTGFQSIICICSRGCGTGPACMNGQVCNNGTCS